MVSVITSRFKGVPGVMALILETLSRAGVAVLQTADSPYSISVLIPEADAQRATRALHEVFELGAAPPSEESSSGAGKAMCYEQQRPHRRGRALAG